MDVFVDSKYLRFYYLYQNWWLHFDRLVIDVPSIVVAEDEKVVLMLRRLHANKRYVKRIHVLKSDMFSTEEAVDYKSTKYNELIS